jgi:hypothetical protein
MPFEFQQRHAAIRIFRDEFRLARRSLEKHGHFKGSLQDRRFDESGDTLCRWRNDFRHPSVRERW